MQKRLKRKERKNQILEAAVSLSIDKGYLNITRDSIATKAGVSHGLVTVYFGTMAQLRRALMRKAIKKEILPIIAQGLVSGDKNTNVCAELRTRALKLYST